MRQIRSIGSKIPIKARKFAVILDHALSLSQEAITRNNMNKVAIKNGKGTIAVVFGMQSV